MTTHLHFTAEWQSFIRRQLQPDNMKNVTQ
jgi:hypothetical protein